MNAQCSRKHSDKNSSRSTDRPVSMEGPEVSQQSNLLRLRTRIRLQICFRVGIVGHPRAPHFIDLGNNGAPDRWRDRQRFLITHILFLTCRTLYNELGRLAYGFNHFFVQLDEDHDLLPLRCLSPQSLSALRWLTIHINVSSCGKGEMCAGCKYPWERIRYENRGKPFEPLSLANEYSRVSYGIC